MTSTTEEVRRIKLRIAETKESSCNCERCKQMCTLPCWPTPDEAAALIELGYADKLMCDWWNDDPDDIEVLCPANPGHEGRMAAQWDRHRGCVMQTNDNGCALHFARTLEGVRVKPWEGRIATCGKQPFQGSPRAALSVLWNTEWGRFVVEYWRACVTPKKQDNDLTLTILPPIEVTP